MNAYETPHFGGLWNSRLESHNHINSTKTCSATRPQVRTHFPGF